MDHIMDTDTIIVLRICSGCHTTQVLNNFGMTNKGVHFKTCDNCRLRNKAQMIKQTKDDSTFNKQLEEDLTYETMILIRKSHKLCSTKF